MINITKQLKDKGLKVTEKRVAILNILSDCDTPLPIEEIYERSKHTTKMNLSTIYRTITLLCKHNIVQVSTSQSGKYYYRLCGHTHEHYLICTKCGKIVSIHHCPLHTLEKEIQQESGFLIEDHRLEFIGICPACQH